MDKILKGAKPSDLPRAAADEVRVGDQFDNDEADRSDDPAVDVEQAG